jgi:hypothetical protein
MLLHNAEKLAWPSYSSHAAKKNHCCIAHRLHRCSYTRSELVRMCMHPGTYTRAHERMRVHVRACMHTCTRTHTHTRTHARTHTHTHTHTHAPTHANVPSMWESRACGGVKRKRERRKVRGRCWRRPAGAASGGALRRRRSPGSLAPQAPGWVITQINVRVGCLQCAYLHC